MLENEAFWEGLNLFTIIVEWLAFLVLLNELGGEKKSSIKSSINRYLSFILILISAFIMSILNIFPNYRVLISLFLSIIYYKINYRVNFSKMILIPLVFWMMLLVIEALSISVVFLINNIENRSVLLGYSIVRLEAIITSKLCLIIGVIFSKYLKLYGEIGKIDFIYIGIPVTTNIISVLLIFSYSTMNPNINMMNNSGLIILSSLLLLSSISIILIVTKVMKNNRLELENKIITEKINMDYNYYMKIEENQSKVRELHHDMKNHMICISNLSNTDEVKKYIENINVKLNSIGDFYNTGNRILDIIMNEKYEICNKNKIELDSYIDFSRANFIDMADICVIFSNALDNSIQACKKITDSRIKKWIKMQVAYVNNFCIIKIENSKVNKILKYGNIMDTNKKDKRNHGIGLKNIKNIVEKYNGQVNIDYTDFKFTVTIMIPIKEV